MEDITTSDGRFVDFAELSAIITDTQVFQNRISSLDKKPGAQSTWGRRRYKLEAQNTNASPGRLMSVE